MNKCCFLAVIAMLGACGAGEAPQSEEPKNPYVLLANSGMPSIGNVRHACVRDTRTGLVWESKSDQQGLHDWRNTYSWFNPGQAHHELDYRGTADGGSCNGSQCDTWDVVTAVNKEKLCGYEDWRIPSKDELNSISDLLRAKSPPTIDTSYFPHTQAAEYWSANDYSFQWNSAWAWNFEYGHDRVDWKKSAKFIRLVRGDALDLAAVKE